VMEAHQDMLPDARPRRLPGAAGVHATFWCGKPRCGTAVGAGVVAARDAGPSVG
jgi:hypothetical protein